MRSKIFRAFLTTIVALAISEAFLIGAHFIIAEKYARISDNLVSEYMLTEKTSSLVESFYDLIQYSNDRKRLEAWQANLRSLEELIAKLDANLAYGSSWPVYVGVKNTVNTVVDDVNKGVADLSAGKFTEVTALYLKAAKDRDFVRDNACNLLLKELSGVEAAREDMNKTRFWSEVTGIALFLAVLIGSLIYSSRFAKKISGPPDALAKAPSPEDKKA